MAAPVSPSPSASPAASTPTSAAPDTNGSLATSSASSPSVIAALSPALAAALDHHRQGALNTAQQAYEQILASPKTDISQAASAHHWLGVLHLQRKDTSRALRCFECALALVPANFASQLNLGHARLQMGDYVGAFDAYDAASRAPEADIAAAAFAALAALASAAGPGAGSDVHPEIHSSDDSHARKHAALAALDRAVALQPDVASFHDSRGSVLNVLGIYDQAEAAHRAAVALQPMHPGFHNNLGLAVKAQGRLDDAIWHFRDALRRDPAHVPALINLGQAVAMTGDFDQASAPLTRAVALAPKSAAAHQELGNVLAAMANYDSALTHYSRAVALDPQAALAWQNLGATRFELGDSQDAGEAFEKALALNPDLALARFNLASIRLAQGQWHYGWTAYEARLKAWHAHPDDPTATPPGVRWRGVHAPLPEAMPARNMPRGASVAPVAGLGDMNSAIDKMPDGLAVQPATVASVESGYFTLTDKRILIYAEQGLGDTIQFFRFCAPVAALAKQLILAVPASLYPLLAPMAAKLAGNITVLPMTSSRANAFADRHIDCHCPLLSLPLALGIYDPDALAGPLTDTPVLGSAPSVPPYIAAPVSDRSPPQWTLPALRRGAKTRLLAGRAVTRIARLTWATRAKRSRPGVHAVPRVAPSHTVDASIPTQAKHAAHPVKYKVGLAWSGKPLGLAAAFPVTAPAPTPVATVTDEASNERRNKHISEHASERYYDKRAIPLTALQPLFDLPNIEWHVLQTEISEDDIDTLTALMAKHSIVWHSQAFEHFADTANAVSELDHVVSIDTSIAHLAGAMGWPVSLMLPLAADWRWSNLTPIRQAHDSASTQPKKVTALGHGANGPDSTHIAASYWYPSVRMFRQTARNDWDPVVRDVAQSLTSRFGLGAKP